MHQLKLFLLQTVNRSRHFIMVVRNRWGTVSIRAIRAMRLHRRELSVLSAVLLLLSLSLLVFYLPYHRGQVSGAIYKQANTGPVFHTPPVSSTAAASIPDVDSTRTAEYPATPAVGLTSPSSSSPDREPSSSNNDSGNIYPTAPPY